MIRRVTRAIHHRIDGWRARSPGALRVQQAEILSADRLGRAIDGVVGASQLVLFGLAIDLRLDLRARALSVDARAVGDAAGLCGQASSSGRGRRRRLLAEPGVRRGHRRDRVCGGSTREDRLRADCTGPHRVREFPGRLGATTNKIVGCSSSRSGWSVAFPYLPGSDSPAFAGVSLLAGVLLSLASSSALSNMIAGPGAHLHRGLPTSATA